MPKVLRLHEYKGPDGLQIDELPLTEPKDNEVRFKVEAFALNYGDFELMENEYMFSMDLPSRIGDEASGVVDAIGPNVTKFKIGDRVSSMPWMNEGYGVNGEFAIVPEMFLAKYPGNLTPAEGCALWVSYLTAYYAMAQISQVKSGDYVLITAAVAAASMAAMDMANLLGATVIGTKRTQQDKDWLLEQGAAHVIITNDEDVSARVQEITGGKGCRVIYDAIGGHFVQRYVGAMGKGCDIYLYGGMDGRPTILPEIEMTQAGAVLRPFTVYNHIYDSEQRSRGVKFVYDAAKSGKIKPRIDRIFAFEDFREAFAYQLAGKGRRGKIIITPAQAVN